MIHPDVSQLKAIIFDVDGTLYRQTPVRRKMLVRLLRAHLKHPRMGYTTFRVLAAYRRAQETLRASQYEGADTTDQQLQLACKECGLNAAMVQPLVTRWMEAEPLDLLHGALRRDTVAMLIEARERGLRLGAFSDYPALEKLKAMKIAQYFDVVVTAQDEEVRRFKPDPRGLIVTARKLGVESREALYVGDRVEVDGIAASRSGMHYAIVKGPSLSFTSLGLN